MPGASTQLPKPSFAAGRYSDPWPCSGLRWWWRFLCLSERRPEEETEADGGACGAGSTGRAGIGGKYATAGSWDGEANGGTAT